MSETDGRPNTRPSELLVTGRKLVEQRVRDSGASHPLASLAPGRALTEQAMAAAMAEEQYLAKCQALGGISAEDARQILDSVIAMADQQGLPAESVWPRAWGLAIEKSMQLDG
jgi:hypothetical protein